MDLDYIESLAELLAGTCVTEVTVRRGARSVTVRRRPGQAGVEVTTAPPLPELPELAPPRAPEPAAPPALVTETALVPVANGQEPVEARFELIRAHRVGIFHRGPAEDGAPLVGVGDWAAPKQQLGCIESMRLYDEVDNPVAGRIVGIFVEDGAPVEYGQPLFHLEVMDAPPPSGAAAGSSPVAGALEVGESPATGESS